MYYGVYQLLTEQQYIYISRPPSDSPIIEMISSLSLLVLASSCLSLSLAATWVDICDYQDSYGSTCYSPSMEQSEYYVVPFEQPWQNQETICQYVGN